jgi:hypothetical protein
MNAFARAWSPAGRSTLLVLDLVSLVIGGLLSPIRAADPSPGMTGVPTASEAPPTMCESLADLRLYVGFLRDQSLDEDGVLPILVGAVASLGEARRLAGLVGETYRPLVGDLIAALEELRSAVRGFGDAGTVGSGLVGVGEAIVRVGASMDVLSAAVQEPCPAASSPAPSPGA